MGELRGAEAFTFLRAINTGHPGSITTVHADTPERALIQIALMTQQAGVGLNYEDALRLARETIDLVVQIEYRGGRRAAEVHRPTLSAYSSRA
jgi:type IV secretion system protein VirB11